MSKTPGPGRHLLGILALPVMVTLVIPATLLAVLGPLDTRWSAGMWAVAGRGGAALIALPGVILLVATIRLLGRVGQGTLAPWDPTRNLVVRGPYRYVRNPMISGVLLVLAAEALALGSLALPVWGAFFFILNNIYFRVSEEPGLLDRFGDQYREYLRHVPRWLPRTTPWEPAEEERPDVGA